MKKLTLYSSEAITLLIASFGCQEKENVLPQQPSTTQQPEPAQAQVEDDPIQPGNNHLYLDLSVAYCYPGDGNCLGNGGTTASNLDGFRNSVLNQTTGQFLSTHEDFYNEVISNMPDIKPFLDGVIAGTYNIGLFSQSNNGRSAFYIGHGSNVSIDNHDIEFVLSE